MSQMFYICLVIYSIFVRNGGKLVKSFTTYTTFMRLTKKV